MLLAGTAAIQSPDAPAATRPLFKIHSRKSSSPADPKVGLNVRIGDDPAQLPTNRLAQAEPHIARSVVEPNLLAAIFQEGRFDDVGAVNCGYAITTNGGLTWKRRLIPHLIADIDGGPFIRASDPVVGIDRKNNIYLNVLGLKTVKPQITTAVVISKSSDGGETFGQPVTIFSSDDPNVFPDKNWLAINTYPVTPSTDRLAATFTYFTASNVVIASAYSDDEGQTWSAPQFFGSSYCQGSQPLFLPDGSLVVIYWNWFRDQIQAVVSEDGGQTFGAPRLVIPVVTTSDPVARDHILLPAVATDRQAGVIYITYKAWLDWPRIMFIKSIDKAKTWSTPAPISDNPQGVSVFDPAIAVSPDGQHVTIIYYDKRHDTGQGLLVDLYLAESFDAGKTWQPNLRLTGVSSDLSLAPLTSQGRMLGDYQGIAPAWNFAAPAVAIWIDTRAGSPDPYSVRIDRTQGTTFQAWQALRYADSELANPQTGGQNADPDNDSMPNLLEYALGLEPRRPDPNPLQITSSGTNAALMLSYTRLAVLGDVAFSWWASTNLTEWQPFIPDQERILDDGCRWAQRIEMTAPAGPAPLSFFRLGVAKTGQN
jgi:hypothetical protein